MNNGFESKKGIEMCTKLMKHFNSSKSTKRYRPISGGLMKIQDIQETGSYIYCKAKLIRDEFPEVSDKIKDTDEKMESEGDNTKGIREETHIAISNNIKHRYPIIAVESTLKGPKYSDIKNFFNFIFINSGNDGEFRFEPLFAFKDDEILDRIEDVANINMVFHHSDVPEYSNIDPKLGTFIKNALNFGKSEYVKFEFGVNFQKKKKRFQTTRLKEIVIDLIGVFRRAPKARKLIKKFDVKAEDRNNNSRLRLFDLIESKVASEISVEKKRPRSQYYNSKSIYDAIREQMEKDFKI